MKLKQYLTESTKGIKFDTEDDINDRIQKDCKPYLNLIKGGMPLYRGMNQVNGSFGIANVRQDREPYGTNPTVFKEINKILENNHHNRRDNSVLCTSNKGHTEIFARNSYMIFPIGNFSYTWMNARDFNMDDGNTKWYPMAPEYYVEDPKGFDTDYKKNLSKPFLDYFHTDKGFHEGYTKGYEFWIKCKQYYYIEVHPGYTWSHIDNRFWITY